ASFPEELSRALPTEKEMNSSPAMHSTRPFTQKSAWKLLMAGHPYKFHRAPPTHKGQVSRRPISIGIENLLEDQMLRVRLSGPIRVCIPRTWVGKETVPEEKRREK
ncbi:hypothetical protein AVEN_198355-1, partial [Araneus ventricosus]